MTLTVQVNTVINMEGRNSITRKPYIAQSAILQ